MSLEQEMSKDSYRVQSVSSFEYAKKAPYSLLGIFAVMLNQEYHGVSVNTIGGNSYTGQEKCLRWKF